MAGDLVRFEPATPARRSYDEIQRMAEAIAKSRLFGVQSVDQVIALMLMAEAEGRHVASAMQDYSVIQGRPSLKAEAMLARFQQAGGKVQWTCLQDDRVAAVFSHPACAPVEIDWDMARAKQAGLGGKDMWRKFPRQMLRARVISEGVRTAFPGALGGMYAPEEIMDFSPASAPPVVAERAAAEEPGQAETPQQPQISMKHSFVADPEPDGLPKGKTAHAARKNGDWERVTSRLDAELSDCATRREAELWWQKVRTTDEEYRALPQDWRKLYRDERYLPVLNQLDDDAIEWVDGEIA